MRLNTKLISIIETKVNEKFESLIETYRQKIQKEEEDIPQDIKDKFVDFILDSKMLKEISESLFKMYKSNFPNNTLLNAIHWQNEPMTSANQFHKFIVNEIKV